MRRFPRVVWPAGLLVWLTVATLSLGCLRPAPLPSPMALPASGVALGEPIPTPLSVPRYSVNERPLACQATPDLAAPVLVEQPPGTVQVLDHVVATASGLWFHDAERGCWVRTAPGPAEIFGDRSVAERYARRFPQHGQLPKPFAGPCLTGCARRPADCSIKAIAAERQYYVPGDREYDRRLVLAERDDRWFCTEAEAVGNGWRRSPP
jgi:hypothetical protein